MKWFLALLLTCLMVSSIIGYVQEPGYSPLATQPAPHQHAGEPCDSESDPATSHHCSCVPCKVPHSQPLFTSTAPAALIYHPAPAYWLITENTLAKSIAISPTVPPPRAQV